MRLAAGGIALLSLGYLLLLPPFFGAAAGWSDPVKIPASVLLLAPLAFCMGVPFPSGMQVVSDRAPGLLPWAWGTNGCTSVIGATLATFIAIHAGFRVVVIAALVLYGVAAWTMGALPGNEGGEAGGGRCSGA